MLKFLGWMAGLGALGALGGLVYSHFTPRIYESEATLAALSTLDPHPADSAASLLKQPQLIQKASVGLTGSPSSVLTESNPVTNFVDLRVQSKSPELSALFAQNLLKAYTSQAQSSNYTLLETKRIQIESQAAKAKQTLDHVRNQITQAKASSGILDVDSKVQQVVTYQGLLAQQRDQASQEIQSMNQQVAQEMSQIKGLSPSQASKITEQANPVLKAYQATLVQLQEKRIGLLQVWREDSNPVQAVEAQIDAVKKDIAAEQLPALTVASKESGPNPIRQTLEQEIANNRAQLASDEASVTAIGNTLKKLQDQSKGLPAAQTQMISLLSQENQAQKRYTDLSTSLDSIALTGVAGQMPTISETLPPTTPTEPIWPNLGEIVSIGLAIGLMLGAIGGYASLGREEAPVVFQPSPQAFPMPHQPLAIGGSSTAAPPLPGRRTEGLMALSLPGGNPSESYRYMVYSLSAKHEDLCRSVLFTGVSSDQVCSEAAAQFAIAMSQTGVRTLLADINLKNCDLTDAFGFKGKSGISDMLGRTMLPVPARDLLLETSHEGLFFLPSGTEESDGLGVYHNLQIAGLLEEFQSKADIRVFNAAPCTLVADAPRLVRYVDDVCLVATPGDESKGLVEKARGILANAGAKNVDVIIVDSKRSKSSFFG